MSTVADTDVAIIGLACRVAGAQSPSQLWDVLISSDDVQRDITRFNSNGYYHPDGGPRKGLTNVRKAYMLEDESIDKFDNAFFYTTPLEAAAMDPQQRMLLEIAYETVENAGIPLDRFRGTNTAVYAGMEGSEYGMVAARDVDATPRYLATGISSCMAANRISYFYDLSGPSMVVDTACSSTMAALHQAVRTLQHGDSRMALVCGAKLILSPDMFIPSSELGFLSPDGKCKSFDASADGYGRGEGVLALLLKPLRLAIEDRDPIRAVIKGTRLNQDGRTQGITLPSADAQERNMMDLYKELGISPSDIQYLEAHGTGTAAGDPLEFSAINAVFNSSPKGVEPLIVGSVKSNIGHLESSSALASFMKVVQCLEKRSIPAQLHFANPNPEINVHSMTIPTNTCPWPSTADGGRRAAINTFGAGGTNGHAVLEAFRPVQNEKIASGDRPYLFKVSAADDASLSAMSLSYAEYAEKVQLDLQDFAYTLLNRRSTLRKSRFFTASSVEEAVLGFRDGSLNALSTNGESKKRTVFLFTGQGAQWPRMGKGLIDHSPLFRAVLYECDHYLSMLSDRPSWSLMEEFAKAKDASHIHKAEFSQPLCTALQLGIVMLLKSWGLSADAVVGHSSGEIAAAYAAGIISMRDAIVIAYYRGLSLSKAMHDLKGSMCAVGLGESDARGLIEVCGGKVQIAAVNSATSCTLSGGSESIDDIVARLKQEKQFCRRLRVDQAYHSHHMLSLASPYLERLESAHLETGQANPSCSLFSSVTGQELDSKDLAPAYWVENMTSTVNFATALAQSVENRSETIVIVEVGPHPALKGPAQEVLGSLGISSSDYFGTCVRGENDFKSLLKSAGAMIAAGLPLATENINASEVMDGVQCSHEPGSVLTDIPSYQWNHSVGFWAESRLSHNIRFREFPRHQLLGSRYVDDIPNRPNWRNQLSLKEVPWLSGLKARGASELPSAIYILMGLEASRQLFVADGASEAALVLLDVQFENAFPLSAFVEADTTIETQFVVAREETAKDCFEFKVFSAPLTSERCWTRLCFGKLGWSSPPKQSPLACTRAIVHDQALFDIAKDLESNLAHGLRDVKMDQGGCRGSFDGVPDKHENYPINPLILCSILVLTPLSLSRHNLPTTFRLSSIASVNVPMYHHERLGGHFSADIESNWSRGSRCDIEIHQDGSSIVLEGARYQADALRTQKPAASSLFFRPMLLPDITKIVDQPSMDLSYLARLVSHKWPMSDIVIDSMPEGNTKSILDAFSLLDPGARRYCRSVQCVGKAFQFTPGCVNFVDSLDEAGGCHLVFLQDLPPSVNSSPKLHSYGLMCAPRSPGDADKNSSFAYVSSVAGLGSEPWSLWRKPSPSPAAKRDRACVLFATMPVGPSWAIFSKKNHIKLTAVSVADFCQRKNMGRFDAIVVDTSEKSVITTWAGKDIMPWMQTLLEWADSILWVTKHTRNPFANVAGTLLRTLQSEKPSLKVRWLVLDAIKGDFDDTSSEQVLQAYNEMLEGENELLIHVRHSIPEILRYYPDDELSIITGLAPPRKTNTTLGNANYSIGFAVPKEPVILSTSFFESQSADTTVTVCVEASVIDNEDIQMFEGQGRGRSSQSAHGTFFSGKLLDPEDIHENCEQRVVGWHPHHVHRNRIESNPENLLPIGETCTPEEAACTYAALSIACCIIDGTARARAGETLVPELGGPLKDALRQVCDQFDVAMIDHPLEHSADFFVTYDSMSGILVNGKRVEVAKYLQSGHGRKTVRRIWQNQSCMLLPSSAVSICDLREAFQSPQQPFSTALLHRDATKAVEHVPIYRESARLFSGDSYYVIVGGLGGLGRFVCSWMIAKGAKHIATISRSGLDRPEAKAAVDAAEASGATIRVFKANACDRAVTSNILATLRADHPIKGVINLAMVLGDAPMESMTGEEWDRAMRVKIDTSWILHEETLQDSLDHFILFSSIASVLGNRNQGSYNVANTFLNALAEYRQSLSLPGVSIALGAMTDMGVLYDLSKPDMLQILSRSGLTQLTQFHLAKIMEAAIYKSSRHDRFLIVTGLEMFERETDGILAGRAEPLFWAELPEFGHLQRYKAAHTKMNGAGRDIQISLKEQIDLAGSGGKDKMKPLVKNAFIAFLSRSLGFRIDAFDPKQELAMYGIDSLSGVACQYWLHKELGVNMSAGKILGGGSIDEIVGIACEKLLGEAKD